ncbi:hypothetical protein sS8_1598 [Methylocaldum marinum]|uniref:TIR domain-containing protein n=1 Tax=Methylocaldum marinum TaxID=1432792 RepID=A0A250KPU3_9GAMM|nr:hypothetical protein sS8_1598 [Methylocaldum marinum]
MPHCDIFICYDRLSAATPASVLYRRLCRYFPPECIAIGYRDILSEGLPPDPLDECVRRAKVILCLITGAGTDPLEVRQCPETNALRAGRLEHEPSLWENRRLIPILYRGAVLPPEFAGYDSFILGSLESDLQIDHLVHLIASVPGLGQLQPESVASKPAPPDERTLAMKPIEPNRKSATHASSPPCPGTAIHPIGIGEPGAPKFINKITNTDRFDNITSLQREAESLWLKGEFTKARILQEMALDSCCRTLGKENPNTLTAMSNLAEMFWALGNVAEAKALHQQVLDVRRYVLGDRHPDTTAAAWNLFLTLTHTSDHAAAGYVIQQYLNWLQDSSPDILSPEQRRIRDMIRQFFS